MWCRCPHTSPTGQQHTQLASHQQLGRSKGKEIRHLLISTNIIISWDWDFYPDSAGTTALCCRPCRAATSRRWRPWGPASSPGWDPTWRPSSSSSRTNPATLTPAPTPTTTQPAGETCPCLTSSPDLEAETPPTCLPGGPWMTRRKGSKLRTRRTYRWIHATFNHAFKHWQ